MSGNDNITEIDLLACRNEVDKNILAAESKMLMKITSMEGDINNLNSSIQLLVSKMEFAPVKLITYGFAGGVMMYALAVVLAKSLGVT